MARKKREGGERPRKKRQKPPPPESVPDRRTLEGDFRRAIKAQLGGEETALDRAQAVLEEAYQTPDVRRRIALARKALEIYPDCADAYVVLGENAPKRREAL